MGQDKIWGKTPALIDFAPPRAGYSRLVGEVAEKDTFGLGLMAGAASSLGGAICVVPHPLAKLAGCGLTVVAGYFSTKNIIADGGHTANLSDEQKAFQEFRAALPKKEAPTMNAELRNLVRLNNEVTAAERRLAETTQANVERGIPVPLQPLRLAEEKAQNNFLAKVEQITRDPELTAKLDTEIEGLRQATGLAATGQVLGTGREQQSGHGLHGVSGPQTNETGTKRI